jgi:hypothetical protein
MNCHVFGGIWCSSSTTFALRCIIDDFDVDDLVAYTILKSFYVDDCITSTMYPEDAVSLVEGTKSALSQAGFNLTKIIINRQELLERIPEVDRAKEVKELTFDSQSKALGVVWKVLDDEFCFDVHVSSSSSVTRRSVLSTLASMYDPLGFLNPVLITGKLIFQEATRERLSWDDAVPDSIADRWSQWIVSLGNLSNVRIPRCIKPNPWNDGVLELHVFCDASQQAYGMCCYLRCVNKDGQIHTALLFSKSRIAPLKKIAGSSSSMSGRSCD